MRKCIMFFLAVSLLVIVFSGCNKTKEPDVWDGTIAETFENGDGSEKKPYIIENASQLAYLAKEVNVGTDYQGKHFTLDCDLDMNNLEWTPIGNGTYSFNGIFDGNNHMIFNLKITNSANFTTTNSNGEISQYTTGLFGSCCDAIIKNITIDKASVTIQNISNAHAIMGGILIGTMRVDSTADISNINVVDADITCAFDLENKSSSLWVGGIVGHVYGNDNSSIKMENINTDATISIENGKVSYNFVGGIVGVSSINNFFDVNNCASYLSVNIDTENFYLQHNYFGAFGSMTCKNNTVLISNIFSKVSINKINEVFHGYSAYNAHAIIGETNHGKQKNGTVIGGYEFQNLFGYVEQVNTSTGEILKSTQLYELPKHAVYTETNCIGCELLPPDHGFDVSVWDITDLSNPKIKIIKK